MKEILHYGLVLMLIGSIAGIGLYGVNAATRPRIEAAQKEALEKGQVNAFPDAASFSGKKNLTYNDVSFSYYTVYNENKDVIGYEVLYSVQGYQSQIQVLSGVRTNGVIAGISVINQAETPGLGAEVEAVPTTETMWSMLGELIGTGGGKTQEKQPRIPPFQAQFAGKKVSDLRVVKQESDRYIEAISGATITSKAVTRCVRKPVHALLAYMAQKEESNAQ